MSYNYDFSTVSNLKKPNYDVVSKKVKEFDSFDTDIENIETREWCCDILQYGNNHSLISAAILYANGIFITKDKRYDSIPIKGHTDEQLAVNNIVQIYYGDLIEKVISIFKENKIPKIAIAAALAFVHTREMCLTSTREQLNELIGAAAEEMDDNSIMKECYLMTRALKQLSTTSIRTMCVEMVPVSACIDTQDRELSDYEETIMVLQAYVHLVLYLNKYANFDTGELELHLSKKGAMQCGYKIGDNGTCIYGYDPLTDKSRTSSTNTLASGIIEIENVDLAKNIIYLKIIHHDRSEPDRHIKISSKLLNGDVNANKLRQILIKNGILYNDELPDVNISIQRWLRKEFDRICGGNESTDNNDEVTEAKGVDDMYSNYALNVSGCTSRWVNDRTHDSGFIYHFGVCCSDESKIEEAKAFVPVMTNVFKAGYVRDVIDLTDGHSEEFISSMFEYSHQDSCSATAPADIIITNTIPLKDVKLITNKNIDVARIKILDDYERSIINNAASKVIDNPLNCEIIGIVNIPKRDTTDGFFDKYWNCLLWLDKKNNRIFVPLKHSELQYVVGSSSNKSPIIEWLKSETRCMSAADDHVISEILRLWYGCQIALLNPIVTEAMSTNVQIRPYHDDTTTKQISTKKKNKIRYERIHYVKSNDIEQCLQIDKSKRGFSRKCLCWYVIGHWRHYPDKTIWIDGFWKGELRHIKQSDESRERSVTPEDK